MLFRSHLDPFRIPAFEQVLFAHAVPGTVILTTPNREYNVKYPALKTGALRHGDHRFEWTRQEFADWAAHVCRSYGYQVVCSGIGEEDPQVGAPTQMGVLQNAYRDTGVFPGCPGGRHLQRKEYLCGKAFSAHGGTVLGRMPGNRVR